MDLKFVFDIIDGQISGYQNEMGSLDFEGPSYFRRVDKINALKLLKSTLQNFIKEVNKHG